MIFFKVLRRTPGGRLVSPIVAGDLAVEYQVGRRTQGVDGTPVFVFSTLESARRLVKSKPWEIWRCVAYDPGKREQILARRELKHLDPALAAAW